MKYCRYSGNLVNKLKRTSSGAHSTHIYRIKIMQPWYVRSFFKLAFHVSAIIRFSVVVSLVIPSGISTFILAFLDIVPNRGNNCHFDEMKCTHRLTLLMVMRQMNAVPTPRPRTICKRGFLKTAGDIARSYMRL